MGLFNLFEWDENKNRKNKIKHGISFQQASGVFKDPDKKTYQDERFDYGEDRFVTIGQTLNALVTAVHTPRKERTRLISARFSNSKERKIYNE